MNTKPETTLPETALSPESQSETTEKPKSKRRPRGMTMGCSLQEAEEFRRLMIERLQNHAVFTLDVDGRMNTWNIAAERMFGFTESQAIGQKEEILFTPEDRSAEAPARVMMTAAETGSASDERWHLRQDGQRIRLSGEMTPIRDETGKLRGFTKVTRDITEQFRAQEALLTAKAELAQRAGRLEQAVAERTMELAERNKHLEAFVYSIVHDLRAPLRAMQGFASLLVSQSGDSLRVTGRDYADRIARGSETMDRMLVDLLQFSRISMQKMELEPIRLQGKVLGGWTDESDSSPRRMKGAGSGLNCKRRRRLASSSGFTPTFSLTFQTPLVANLIVSFIENRMKFSIKVPIEFKRVLDKILQRFH